MSAQPTSARLIISVTLAGLLAGLLLAATYRVTQPLIEANQQKATETAIFQVLPGTDHFESFWAHDGILEPIENPLSIRADQQVVYLGRDGQNQMTGFAIPAAGPGFQDTIKVLYGFDPNKREIIGFQVLDSRETPGLGDKILKDPAFLGSFKHLAVEPVILLQTKGPPQHNNEVDAISGATISSRAIVNLLNKNLNPLLDLLSQKAQAEGGPHE
ncbi:MAG: RnfABCDGE type electron transport complex subunit G [Acidobacteria bacterium]|nr:RnfABCDGE type electron transport complex subunit G [Acidobacteriota bacterium]MCB9398017.1 RnfABCDGE type electron transport complex subunit G [Acidobacteriota bacterium]